MPTTVLFVQEREEAIQFYTGFLFQEVEMDLGACVSFQSGFSVWESTHVTDVTRLDPANSLIRGRGGMEMYFEIWDLDRLYSKMEEAGVRIVHQIIEQPWAQRVFRCIDPAGHFIEVGESLIVTARRLSKLGKSSDEIAQLFGFPLEQVEGMINLGKRLPKEVKKYYKKGQSVKQIARKYELGIEIIQELLLELEEVVE